MLTEGSHIIYFKVSDDAANVEGEEGEWNWQFYKDTIVSTDPTSVNSTSHSVGIWSSDNTIDIAWEDATDATSGLDGYSILWDTDNTTIPDQTMDIEEGVQAATSPALADGNSHYVHIRSVDNAGNWQSTVHLGPFYIYTPLPTKPPTVTVTTTDDSSVFDLSEVVTTEGEFNQDVEITSTDDRVNITIFEDTIGITGTGEPVTEITITGLESPPTPVEGAHIIGLAYDIEAGDATFDEPITITFTYDPTDIPEGVSEEDLILARYDEDAGVWVELITTVDPETNTVSAQITHLSKYAILVTVIVLVDEEHEIPIPTIYEEEEELVAEEEEVVIEEEKLTVLEEEEEPVPTLETTIPVTKEEEPSGGLVWWVWLLIGIVVVALLFGAIWIYRVRTD